jgi:hypothetical protein
MSRNRDAIEITLLILLIAISSMLYRLRVFSKVMPIVFTSSQHLQIVYTIICVIVVDVMNVLMSLKDYAMYLLIEIASLLTAIALESSRTERILSSTWHHISPWEWQGQPAQDWGFDRTTPLPLAAASSAPVPPRPGTLCASTSCVRLVP